MCLRLIIPQKELTKNEQRMLKIRRASAKRWRSKLQRPFPIKREIKEAYTFKLMRHYPNQLVAPLPNFVKPTIEKSLRVDRLLKRFPVLSTSFMAMKPMLEVDCYGSSKPPTSADPDNFEKDTRNLRANKGITKSEYAQWLAWKNFSSREPDRVDRGREAMMESGLEEDNLVKEETHQQNQLPEWRKLKTGKFAKWKLAAGSRNAL